MNAIQSTRQKTSAITKQTSSLWASVWRNQKTEGQTETVCVCVCWFNTRISARGGSVSF